MTEIPLGGGVGDWGVIRIIISSIQEWTNAILLFLVPSNTTPYGFFPVTFIMKAPDDCMSSTS
jgi:hypothetical protein